jgi:hypothetical protein
MANDYNEGYGKRPMWQWVLIYLVLAAVVYGLVYYFVFAGKGGYSTPSTTNTNGASGSAQVQTTGSVGTPAPSVPGY